MNQIRFSRWTPFVGSLAVAGLFIAIRIFYRLVFGQFSLEALSQAVIAALPFAGIIVLCGLLSSVVDVRRFVLVSSHLRFGRSLATALALGLATVPALAVSVARLRQAARLRGVHQKSALLVPLLEHSLERSVSLAAALELAGTEASPVGADGRVVFNGVTVSYDSAVVLRDFSLTLEPGSVTVLTGPTGSGKSTVLDLISGLAQHFNSASVTGSVLVGGLDRAVTLPRETGTLIGVVGQNPRLGFVGATVREELEWGSRLRGASTAQAHAEATEVASRFGLSSLLSQPVHTLSAGQATRVAIAAALARNPRILLLDEPFAELDETATVELVELLSAQAEAGLTIVIAEHHTRALEALNPRWLAVEQGAVTEGRWPREAHHSTYRQLAVIGDDQAFQLDEVSMNYRGKPLQVLLGLTARVGDVVSVQGANGAGKSSLLSALAGSSPAEAALVPEEVSDFFVRTTLREELAYADKVAKVEPGLTELSFRSILGSREAASVDALLETHPRDLSAGTQRALAIALQLSHKPRLVLIDEPTRGLDPHARQDMAEVLRCVAETGTVVMFATHDVAWSTELTSRTITLAEGAVVTSTKVGETR